MNSKELTLVLKEKDLGVLINENVMGQPYLCH